MNKILMIYLQNVPTTGSFDNTIIADILDADIGYALTYDGKSIQDYYLQDYIDVLNGNIVPVKTSTVFHENFCVTSDDLLSDQVKLSTGETVNVNDYDLLLISHVWFYNYYIRYLKKRYPKIKIIGIQEEAVQDVASFSPYLQMLHLRTLSLFDGYIAVNRQFYDWISKLVQNILCIPLPIPRDQFQKISVKKIPSNSVCVGIGTWNLDCSNFYTNLMVLQTLRNNGFSLRGEIIGIKNWQRKQVDGYLNGVKDIEVYGEIGDSLYNHLSRMKIAIILTTRATSGRISAEFAALGVPCIGNVNNELQAKCWPELSIEPYNVPKAVSLAKKLLQDRNFYESNVKKALEQVKELLNHQPVYEKLNAFINKVIRNSEEDVKCNRNSEGIN